MWGVEEESKCTPPHARLGHVGSAQQSRLLGDSFGEVGRPCAEASGQMGEVHDVGMEVSCDPDVVSFSLGEGQLEGAEQPT